MNKILNINLLICFSICFTFLLSQEDPTPELNNPELHKIEVKEELPTWDDFYKRSIGIGFASSTPMNKALSESDGVKSGFRFNLTGRNLYSFGLYNWVINIDGIASIEWLGELANYNFSAIVNIPFQNIFSIGGGIGLSILTFDDSLSEIKPGLIFFDIHSTLPVLSELLNAGIGLNMNYILTSYSNENIEHRHYLELSGSSSTIFNFYVSLDYLIN